MAMSLCLLITSSIIGQTEASTCLWRHINLHVRTQPTDADHKLHFHLITLRRSNQISLGLEAVAIGRYLGLDTEDSVFRHLRRDIELGAVTAPESG